MRGRLLTAKPRMNFLQVAFIPVARCVILTLAKMRSPNAIPNAVPVAILRIALLACLLCGAGLFTQAQDNSTSTAPVAPPPRWGTARPIFPRTPPTNQPPTSPVPQENNSQTSTQPATNPSGQNPAPTAQNIAPVAAAPAVAPLPPAVPAMLHYENGLLTINANDAELKQIFHDTATLTGMKITGPVPIQRVYGSYGPGAPAVILGGLLEGSGYNYIFSHLSSAAGEFVISSQNGDAPVDADATPSADTKPLADPTQPQQATTPSTMPQPNTPPGASPMTPQQIADRLAMMKRWQDMQQQQPPKN